MRIKSPDEQAGGILTNMTNNVLAVNCIGSCIFHLTIFQIDRGLFNHFAIWKTDTL